MANESRLPNLKTPAQSRAIVTGAIATAVGVVVVVPFYNKVLAPAVLRVSGSLRAAGFLPKA